MQFFNQLTHIQKGMLLAFVGYSGFAISDASAKFLTAHYDTFQIIAYIMLFAAVILLVASPLMGGLSAVQPGKVKYHALRTLMNFLVSVLIVLAFAQLPLASIYAIIFAKPFLAALLAIPMYGERVSRARWIAIGIGFCGVLIAIRPSADGVDLALLLPLGAALCSAIMWVSSRSLEGESVFSMGFYPIFGTCVLSFLVTLSGLGSAFTLPAVEHLVFFIICGFGVSAGVIGLSIAFRMAPSAVVSPFHYSQMIWGIMLGFLVFSDLPDRVTLAGAAVIISSGLFLIWSEQKA